MVNCDFWQRRLFRSAPSGLRLIDSGKLKMLVYTRHELEEKEAKELPKGTREGCFSHTYGGTLQISALRYRWANNAMYENGERFRNWYELYAILYAWVEPENVRSYRNFAGARNWFVSCFEVRVWKLCGILALLSVVCNSVWGFQYFFLLSIESVLVLYWFNCV